MEEFDYNEVFMGVVAKKKRNYYLTVKDDYRIKYLTEAVKLKNGRLLDIGCGGGLLTESLPYYYPNVRVYGYDVSSTAINYAKKFGSGKVTYRVMKGKKIPYQDNFFDVCICLDVMEHIPDVEFFLREVNRVLKKAGKFYLAVPCEGQPFTFTWFFQKIHLGDKLTFKNWGHIHPEFTHSYIIKLLEKYGMIIESESYSEHLLYQIVNLITYFIPKELMGLFLGGKASQYYDRGIVEKEVQGKREKDFFDNIRNIWLSLGKILNGFAINIEIDNLKKVSYTGWKMHILSRVEK